MNGSRYSYGKIEDREESFIRRDSMVSDDRRFDVCFEDSLFVIRIFLNGATQFFV